MQQSLAKTGEDRPVPPKEPERQLHPTHPPALVKSSAPCPHKRSPQPARHSQRRWSPTTLRAPAARPAPDVWAPLQLGHNCQGEGNCLAGRLGEEVKPNCWLFWEQVGLGQ